MSTKPDSLRSQLRAVLAGIASPLGATNSELQDATGMDAVKLSRVVHCLSKSKQIHMVHRGRHTRYFATSEARDAAAPEVNAIADAIKTATRAVNDAKKAARYHEKMKARPPKLERPPKPLKPPKIVKPKAKKYMPANVTVKARATQANFRDQPAIIPPHIRVQQIAGFDGDRWKTSLPVDGFHSEWLILRRGEKCA